MDRENISSKELSEIMHITQQAVYRWQRGKALPSLNNLFILGGLLKSTVDDILVTKVNYSL